MRKTIFAVLAALVMSLGFMSCSGSPEEEMVGYLEDMVALVKDTHIKSSDDVKTFAKKAKDLQEKVEALQKKYGKDYESTLSEEEQKEIGDRMTKIMMELMPEMERLQKEAKDADLSPEDLKELEDALN